MTHPDLANRRVGGSVVAANDELFAERENLIKPGPPSFETFTFGHKGQVYDGWETRRRREPGSDWAIVRLGMPGIVRSVIVDTAFFKGNYPPEVSLDGLGVEGYPSPAELAAETGWTELLPRSAADGDTANEYSVDSRERVTHVRLWMHPDGGVARLRVHGEPIPDPRLLPDDGVDLAALANGARITGCSNMFYSSPNNLIAPGPARVMGDGWETARRRDDGNDWVALDLAAEGTITQIEVDTTHFVGNAPGWVALSGTIGSGEPIELLPRTRVQPDTVHLFRVRSPEVVAARIDVFPDGGLARLRLRGRPSQAGRLQLAQRWWETLPDAQARAVLAMSGGATAAGTESESADRRVESLPAALRAELGVVSDFGSGGA